MGGFFCAFVPDLFGDEEMFLPAELFFHHPLNVIRF